MDDAKSILEKVYGSTHPVPITTYWSSLPAHLQQLLRKSRQGEAVERLCLLSRLDPPGEALAHPESVTEDERNMLLGRPPKEILESNIRRIFPAASSEPEHLGGEGGKESNGHERVWKRHFRRRDRSSGHIPGS